MRAVDLVAKKRDGAELSREEIEFLVRGYTHGQIPDYQMSAFLMAVYFQGMSPREIADLTRAMIESGETVTFPEIARFKVDKHSTGGVGDKTTLVLAPLLASLGVVVPKLSGRGLGHTGGTLDKLESIPGFRTNLSIEEFQRVANEAGVAVTGATRNLVPADQKIYALRDVTATVESIPLLATSIMSKKLAVQDDALIIDVKVGDGSFFRAEDDARRFAAVTLDIGRTFGRSVVCVLTAMEQPLGSAIGNALEVREAIATLQGEGDADLVEVCLALATAAVQGKRPGVEQELRAEIESKLHNGEALEVFRRWIECQGGDPRIVDDPDGLPQARHRPEVYAPRSGRLTRIGAHALGDLAQQLGAGRARKEDAVDPGAGIVLHAKVGAEVREGDCLAVLHTDREPQEEWTQRFLAALSWDEDRGTPSTTVLDTIRS